ncbi:MAG: hypothetical protein AAGF12_37960 [Myxococcota bacterium]
MGRRNEGHAGRDSPPRHFIDAVNLSTGEVRRLSAGADVATARFGGDGALYVAVSPPAGNEQDSPNPRVLRYVDPFRDEHTRVAFPIAL